MLLTSRSSLGHPTLAARVYSMQKRIRIAPGSRLEDAGGDGRAGYSARKARLQRILGRSFVSSSRSYGSLGLAEICSGLGPCASRILPILFQRPPDGACSVQTWGCERTSSLQDCWTVGRSPSSLFRPTLHSSTRASGKEQTGPLFEPHSLRTPNSNSYSMPLRTVCRSK